MTSSDSNDANKSKFKPKKEHTFKILVATDCHLGYEEDDPTVGEDSFKTFEEILIKASENEVDFILLGGDLFHYNNPSQKSMNKCLELLRKYTMGNKEVYFELLSNANDVLSNTSTVNYLDENINISIPVFSIHGNHDDPSGSGHYSCLDTLSSAGLVNYFGKLTDLSRVVVKPILLRKGKTKLALYGLSHIKDDRLFRLFREEKVTLVRPKEDADSWVNILVLHQNRADRGRKKSIEENLLPNFINLVIWGHEHECDIKLFQNTERGFYVTQPGSSVATSLCEGESKQKHIGLLKVCENRINLIDIKLNTVRPFVWESFDINEIPVSTANREKKSEEIKNFCVRKVEEMIEKSKELLTGHPAQPKLPLIRLRCEYSDETQMFNPIKFAQIFYKRVANPNGEVIKFKKILQRKQKEENEKVADIQRLNENYQHEIEEMESFSDQITDFIQEYFSNPNNGKLLVLDSKAMGDAVEAYLEKDDTNSVETIVDKIYKRKSKKLAEAMCENEEQVKSELEKLRDQEDYEITKKENGLTEKDGLEAGNKITSNRTDSGSETDPYDADDVPNPQPTSNRSNAKIQSKTPGRTSRASTTKQPIIIDSDEDISDEEKTGKGKGRGRGRGRVASTATGSGKGSRVGKGRGRAAATDSESSTGKKKQPSASARAARRKPLPFNSSNVAYDDSD